MRERQKIVSESPQVMHFHITCPETLNIPSSGFQTFDVECRGQGVPTLEFGLLPRQGGRDTLR